MKEMPKIGLGFWQIAKEDAGRVFKDGLEAGYRHIDTAIAYRNEQEIGDAFVESKFPREELWITSKVPAEVKSYEEAKRNIDESLARLQCGYLDLMLIHAPMPWDEYEKPWAERKNYDKENVEVWRALVEAKKAGKIRNIGVSNFTVKDIENILNNSNEEIFANQILVCIGCADFEAIEFCQEKGIIIEGYAPNATGKLLKFDSVKAMADKYGVSISQLAIRYDLQLGTYPLPRSKNKDHIVENLKVDFVISEEDMKCLKELKTI